MKITQLAHLLMLLALTSCWGGDPMEEGNSEIFQQGTGVVTYNKYQPLAQKPVQVHYYIPKGDISKMPILFLFPGVNRNADDYLEAWKAGADKKGILLFALEFSTKFYPSADYIEGGMFLNKKEKTEAEWTFSLIEPLFQYICQELSIQPTSYDMWGHSAGAQFVHRYLLFKPDAPIGQAISANAGWYTVPDWEVEFPYGLKDSPSNVTKIKKALSNQLILQLGQNDTNPNDANLNHSPETDKQGLHRYERGLYFWEHSSTLGAEYGNFNWEKREVPGVAHSYTQMAANAISDFY
ncbi:MAG: hypothetical protein ACRCUJ_13305 [Phocaeicola sp.]